MQTMMPHAASDIASDDPAQVARPLRLLPASWHRWRGSEELFSQPRPPHPQVPGAGQQGEALAVTSPVSEAMSRHPRLILEVGEMTKTKTFPSF